jgi:hypothetical protein
MRKKENILLGFFTGILFNHFKLDGCIHVISNQLKIHKIYRPLEKKI